MTRVENDDTTGTPSKDLARRFASNTRRPDGSAASTCIRTAPGCSRRAARSARIATSARTRPSLRVRRALMPCLTHTSSSASFLSNFSWSTASFASHSSFFRRNVA